jgi:hypothetical protein
MRIVAGQSAAQMALQVDGPALSAPDRVSLYRRVIGAPGHAGEAARPNREFEDLWLRLVANVAQFTRQVEAGSTVPARDVAPLSVESVRKAARDLATHAAPRLEAAWAERDTWQVVDRIAGLGLGGAANTARHRTLAESGGAILEWLARPGDPAHDAATVDADIVRAAQQWLAASGARDGDVEALASPGAARRVADWSHVLRHALGLGEVAVESSPRRPDRVAALFAGPAGTGKTMAAHLLAAALGRDAYRVDLSRAVSRYVGETEKNLDAIFRSAGRSDAVLVLDEADALFGRRTGVRDAHDRYANRETGYLLDCIERYDGVVIVTSSRRDRIDPDVLDRLRAVVAFPLPPRT